MKFEAIIADVCFLRKIFLLRFCDYLSDFFTVEVFECYKLLLFLNKFFC